ncbi:MULTISPECIES: YtxH domain-containing protein [Paenibacillus]|uniref:YtxH domain-containing protein n=1 Tax=Paenibacillus TaxID=44249 RepID=UPI001F403AE3|nr:YtxH domain-containing protein [Paenibacillus sp. JJ-223]CAH1215311.1 hypothetical protein PAECIP111890_04252 [Paenibacillus sp. JJ-223]
MKDSNKSLLWGALIGSVVGSVTALLLAPKSGRELRQDISEGARQVTEKGQELVSKVGEQGTNLVSKVKEAADVVIHDIQSWRSGSSSKELLVSAIPANPASEDHLSTGKEVDEIGKDAALQLPEDESKNQN